MYHSFQSGASPFVTFFYIPALRKKADGFRSVQTTETISLKAVQTYALELPSPLAFMTAHAASISAQISTAVYGQGITSRFNLLLRSFQSGI